MIKMVGRFGDGKGYEITQSHFPTARDILLPDIFIDNGHRAGVLANMTNHDFRLLRQGWGEMQSSFSHKRKL